MKRPKGRLSAKWPEVAMTGMSVSEVKAVFGDVLNRVAYRGERIALERRGRTVAYLISPEDMALLEALEDRLDVEDSRRALAEEEFVPYDQVRKELKEKGRL